MVWSPESEHRFCRAALSPQSPAEEGAGAREIMPPSRGWVLFPPRADSGQEGHGLSEQAAPEAWPRCPSAASSVGGVPVGFRGRLPPPRKCAFLRPARQRRDRFCALRPRENPSRAWCLKAWPGRARTLHHLLAGGHVGLSWASCRVWVGALKLVGGIVVPRPRGQACRGGCARFLEMIL